MDHVTNGAISTHAHRVDKMSGIPREWKIYYTTKMRKLVKRYTNAKRRRYLNNLNNI